jgi:hypothetical protein
MSWDCHKKKNTTEGGEAHIFEAQKRNVEEKTSEEGRSLMTRKVLINLRNRKMIHFRETICLRLLTRPNTWYAK